VSKLPWKIPLLKNCIKWEHHLRLVLSECCLPDITYASRTRVYEFATISWIYWLLKITQSGRSRKLFDLRYKNGTNIDGQLLSTSDTRTPSRGKIGGSINALVILGPVQPDASHNGTSHSRHNQSQSNTTSVCCFTLYQFHTAWVKYWLKDNFYEFWLRAVLKKMKKHKAPGLSGLVAEMIQATGDTGNQWVQDQEEDQRGPGERLSKRTV